MEPLTPFTRKVRIISGCAALVVIFILTKVFSLVMGGIWLLLAYMAARFFLAKYWGKWTEVFPLPYLARRSSFPKEKMLTRGLLVSLTLLVLVSTLIF